MPSRPTEQDLLRADLLSLRELIQLPNLLSALADTTDLPLQSYRMVLSDLAWQGFYHSLAAELMLKEELEPSLHVIERSLFEVAVGIGYLVMHPQRHDEAIIFLAYTHLRDQKESPDQQELVSDRAAVLARMPAAAVTEAKRRLESFPFTWSGKKIKKMAEEGKVSGYDTLYSFLSGPAHAGVAGRYVKVFPNSDGTRNVRTGSDVAGNAAESHANFIRRTLRSFLQILAASVPGIQVPEPTWDPELWPSPSDAPVG